MRSISKLAAFAALASSIAAAVVLSGPGTGQTSTAAEQPFLKDNEDAMSRMMAGMTPKPTGDIDRDFAAMMIPHHQGAIDMAVAELKYGRDDQLRRIAQEIIVDQQQEIAAMRLALDHEPPASPSDHDASGHPMTKMMEQAR